MDLLLARRVQDCQPEFETSYDSRFWAVLGLESLGWVLGGGTRRRVATTSMLEFGAIFYWKNTKLKK